jgi:arginine decarboxylase
VPVGPDPVETALRRHAPLLDAYLTALDSRRRPFTIPGHKHRATVGRVTAGDVPLYGGLDTVKQQRGTLAHAEQLAARLWKADFARFSVGGSTHGNQAFALAVGRPGERVVVPRTLHRSLLLGLVLADLEPVWLPARVDSSVAVPLAATPDDVRHALAKHADVCAVFIGDPTYIGTTGDVAGVAAAAHAAGKPLIVDAAWAAHFGFHPALPPHPLAVGADGMVTSAHKMLPAYSQAALVLARTERLDKSRLDAAFEATNTTSPAGSILASIDAARALLETEGHDRLDDLVNTVATAREILATVPGLRVLEPPLVDPTRLVVVLPGTGADGIAIEQDLIDQGMPVEMADRDYLAPIVTMADGRDDVLALTDAIVLSVEGHRGRPRPVSPAAQWTLEPDMVMSPREAYFAPHQRRAAQSAIGRISAELVAPYPPGIPVLAPGERITADALASLLDARAAGVRIAYASDPSLTTLLVIG